MTCCIHKLDDETLSRVTQTERAPQRAPIDLYARGLVVVFALDDSGEHVSD